MGKIEELIEKYKQDKLMARGFIVDDLGAVYKEINEVIEDLQQLKSSLPTQQDKVVVPELIHKWIKHVKGLTWGLADLLNPSVSNSYLARDAKEWLEKDKINAEILARAWLEDDYTVEKEQLYYVEIPLPNKVNGCGRLGQSRSGGLEVLYTKISLEPKWKTQFTENEIKAIDERYWAFAVPVEEDE